MATVADGLRTDGHRSFMDELVVDASSGRGVVIDEGIESRGLRAQPSSRVGVNEDIVDMVYLKSIAVDEDVDAEKRGRIGGVDAERDYLWSGMIVTGFAQVVDDTVTLGGQLVLVVGLTSTKW